MLCYYQLLLLIQIFEKKIYILTNFHLGISVHRLRNVFAVFVFKSKFMLGNCALKACCSICLRAQMKEGRRAGGITAGPESKVLDGGTWEDRVNDVNRSYVSGDVDYKVGAASKGIIQRDFQHHATVYGSAYAKNPFDNVSAEELQEYQRIIDSKSRNDGKDFPLLFYVVVMVKFYMESKESHWNLPPGLYVYIFLLLSGLIMSPGIGDMSYGDTTGDYDCSTSATAAAGATAGTTQSQSNKASSMISPVLSPTSDTEHDGNMTNKLSTLDLSLNSSICLKRWRRL